MCRRRISSSHNSPLLLLVLLVQLPAVATCWCNRLLVSTPLNAVSQSFEEHFNFSLTVVSIVRTNFSFRSKPPSSLSLLFIALSLLQCRLDRFVSLIRKQLRLLPLRWFNKLLIAFPFGRLSLPSVVVARIVRLFIRLLSLHVHIGSISPITCFNELKQKDKLLMLHSNPIRKYGVAVMATTPQLPYVRLCLPSTCSTKRRVFIQLCTTQELVATEVFNFQSSVISKWLPKKFQIVEAICLMVLDRKW